MRPKTISLKSRFFCQTLCALTVSVLFLAACSTSQLQENAPPITAYTNIKMFDGSAFKAETLCVSYDQIVDCVNQQDEMIDLGGLYVTPPFGDAHTHHFDGQFTFDWHLSLGRQSGTFYAMTMTAPTSGVLAIRDKISGDGIVDVASSLGGITGPDSHPAEVYEALALGIRSPEDQIARADEIRSSTLAADNAYYVIETGEDARTKIALLLESDPDHIKVFLRESERYAEGTGKWGPGGGIDPELLPLLGELAGAAGKRLAVSTSSLFDYRVALDAGVDIITHLPCYQDTENDPKSPYYSVAIAEECLLGQEEASRTAELGAIPTLIVSEWAKDRPQKWVDWELENVATLNAAKVHFVVATNAYGSTLTPGLIAGVEKGFFTPAQVLKMASMNTPAAIFPNRSVGCLDTGCEASFISFADNPLEDFSTISEIVFALKDGQVVISLEEDET